MQNHSSDGYIIHHHVYTDSKVILTLFTLKHGLVKVVARLGKQAIEVKYPLFQAGVIVWRGRNELKTLVNFEANGKHLALKGQYLFCGFYLNELLSRLALVESPMQEIYELYGLSLNGLALNNAMEPFLRAFEFKLIESLGYGFSFFDDVETGRAIAEEKYYLVLAERGFIESQPDFQYAIPGRCLINIGQYRFDDEQTLKHAKRLSRYMLQPLLGGRPLKSRELFQ